MSEQFNFISGIYNYCDYVCEKCVFTDRCYLYWAENQKHEESNPLEVNFRDLLEDYEEMESTFEEEEDPFEDFKNEKSEQRTQEIIAPSVKIVEVLDPVMEHLTEKQGMPDVIRKAISLVLENYLLITVKYYRAVHQTDFDVEAEIDQLDIYSYMDTEKTLLALKSFNWNLRAGLSALRAYFPEYMTEFAQALDLSREIENRVDEELLPATRIILKKHSSSLGNEDII